MPLEKDVKRYTVLLHVIVVFKTHANLPRKVLSMDVAHIQHMTQFDSLLFSLSILHVKQGI